MDEWAPLSRVDLKRGPVKDTAKDSSLSHDLGIDGYERKLTRNQKRKHDEINHVQKVNYWSRVISVVCVRACPPGVGKG